MDKLDIKQFFHKPWLNLPNIWKVKDTNVFYKLGKKPGFFYDDLQCVVQCVRRGRVCTATIENSGRTSFSQGTSLWWFRVKELDGISRYISIDTPDEVFEKFPILKKITYSGYSPFKDFSFSDLITSNEWYEEWDKGAKFMFGDIEPLEDSFSKIQAWKFLDAVDFILDVEDEYERFKASVVYSNLKKDLIRKQSNAQNAAGVFMALKLLKLGYSIYTGTSDNDNILTNDNYDFADIDVSDGDYSDLISNHDISFTGNSDNSSELASLQQELRKAQHDVDYYSGEINNFNDKTSSTYRSTCESHLNNATSRIRDIKSKISRLS